MSRLLSLTENQRSALLDGIKIFCQLFWGPTLLNCRELLQQAVLRKIEPILPLLTFDPPDTFKRVAAAINQFENERDLFDYLEARYVGLFVSNRKGHTVPLYQSCYEYENAVMMGAPAVMMKERLAAVDLSLGTHIKEPPDHLSVELEYLYFLLTRGFTDDNPVLTGEAASFASNVMLDWVADFRKQLMSHQDSEFYSLATSLMIAVLQFVGDSG